MASAFRLAGVKSLAVVLGAAALGFLGLVPQAHAAPRRLDQYATRSWRVADGLPGDSVQAIAQGLDGQLWVATLGGLARYDGIRFTRVAGPSDGRGAAIDLRRLLAARDGSVLASSP